MKVLKAHEVKSIEQFFQLTQENLLKIMDRYLNSKYEDVYTTNDYIVAVGDIPVALVAHLDTVFTSPPENIFYDRIKNVMWSPEGLGADDRAGVYAIIQILKRGFKPTVIFTTDEERGALGAEKLINDHPEAICDLKYIIQLDRRGSNDCVFYDCLNLKFEEYVEKFGFVTSFGTFSDISIICPAWGIAGVNLSIGYINEHSYSEILYIGNMLATIQKVENMLLDIKNVEKPFEYISSYKTAYGYDYFGWDPSYGISKETWRAWCSPKEMGRCDICGVSDYEYNLFPVKNLSNGTTIICSHCISDVDNLGWCATCGEPYLSKPNDTIKTLCYDCREGENANGKN